MDEREQRRERWVHWSVKLHLTSTLSHNFFFFSLSADCVNFFSCSAFFLSPRVLSSSLLPLDNLHITSETGERGEATHSWAQWKWWNSLLHTHLELRLESNKHNPISIQSCPKPQARTFSGLITLAELCQLRREDCSFDFAQQSEKERRSRYGIEFVRGRKKWNSDWKISLLPWQIIKVYEGWRKDEDSEFDVPRPPRCLRFSLFSFFSSYLFLDFLHPSSLLLLPHLTISILTYKKTWEFVVSPIAMIFTTRPTASQRKKIKKFSNR